MLCTVAPKKCTMVVLAMEVVVVGSGSGSGNGNHNVAGGVMAVAEVVGMLRVVEVAVSMVAVAVVMAMVRKRCHTDCG